MQVESQHGFALPAQQLGALDNWASGSDLGQQLSFSQQASLHPVVIVLGLEQSSITAIAFFDWQQPAFVAQSTSSLNPQQFSFSSLVESQQPAFVIQSTSSLDPQQSSFSSLVESQQPAFVTQSTSSLDPQHSSLSSLIESQQLFVFFVEPQQVFLQEALIGSAVSKILSSVDKVLFSSSSFTLQWSSLSEARLLSQQSLASLVAMAGSGGFFGGPQQPEPQAISNAVPLERILRLWTSSKIMVNWENTKSQWHR
jgi:hypothetical protein